MSTTPTPSPKPRRTRAKAAAATTPSAPAPATPKAPPTCAMCGQPTDTYRDQAYGRDGACKRCTQRARKAQARGRFIPAAEYVAQLARGGRA